MTSPNPPCNEPTPVEGSARETGIETTQPGLLDLLPLVGIGGSAGSIPALQEFFRKMPKESGMAFVVIMHLAPDMESLMPEVLARETRMTVKPAEDGEKLQANQVYVIPAGKILSSVDGELKLENINPSPGRRVAVDHFFRSLADTHGRRSASIVLSGADGDGAVGLKRVKEAGGLTIAQDPEEAEHPDMPATAISTGMVDWVLKVAEMPERLVEYFSSEQRLRLPPEDGPPILERAEDSEDGGGEAALRDVLLFVKAKTGRNFSDYKRATVIRRISRRMQVNGIESMHEYLSFLRTHGGEAGALVQDLLISVTNFFRDPEAFAVLEENIPKLFEDKTAKDAVRVWVPASATGEEAYSIAILLLEHAGTLERPPRLQVFGCDLDAGAIQVARLGIYPKAIEADVSEPRLKRFFISDGRTYRVTREVREMVLFATHDLLNDPPFSRMDMISCRNFLIYLNAAAQERWFSLISFALKQDGLLFLGTAESIEGGNGAFEPIHKKARLYFNRGTRKPCHPSFLIPQNFSPPAEVGQISHLTSGASFRAERMWQIAKSDEVKHPPPQELHLALIERLSPPSMLVNGEFELVHLSGSAGKYLQHTGGEPTRQLLRIIHPELRAEVRALLYRTVETGSQTETARVPMELEGNLHHLTLRVSPANDLAEGYMLITIQAVESPADEAPEKSNGETEPVIRYLEFEIDRLKLMLQETVEDYETAAEELKANNEELQAMNEEMRSATEELETSREELKSINEELSTVNQELRSNLDELARANSDLSNLMASTAIATIFLDRQLSIMRYTPPALDLFRMIPGDVGRPLNDLKHRLDYPQLIEDCAKVLSQLVVIEREVSDPDHHCYLVRVLPYRTPEDFIGGVVMTFVDITAVKKAEQALSRSEEHLRLVIENAREYAIFSTDLERRIQSWNCGAERILGYTEEEIIGQVADIIFVPEDCENNVPSREAKVALKEGRAADERWHQRKDGSRFWASGSMMAMHDGRSEAIGLVKILSDETASREAQEALEKSRNELMEALQENRRAREEAEAASLAKDEFLASLSHELRTPLNPVLMMAAALEEDPRLPGDVNKQIGMMRRNVELEARLIDDLLDATKIARGGLALTPVPCDVHKLLREAAAIVANDPEMLRAKPKFDFHASECWVMGEPARLQQIFWNLLKNAFKFSTSNTVVTVRTRNVEPDWVDIDVIDQGIGISSAGLSRIFTAFDQGDLSSRHRFGGLGLGLAISKALIELHGGTLSVHSDGPDQGATFTVRLRVTAPMATGCSDAPRGKECAESCMRLLVVEDHAPSLEALVHLLEMAGHQVLPAKSVKEALEVAASNELDLVISDLGLPDDSGYALMKEMRRHYTVPGIALSGYGMPKDIEESTAAGFSAHLTKPITLNALREAIIGVLGRQEPES